MIVFISVNIAGARIHGLKMFSLFLPSGTTFPLSLLLVPIEFVSYMFKPISLSVRLFANLMAGHTLLKVIAGFGWALMGCTGFLFLAHYVPLAVLRSEEHTSELQSLMRISYAVFCLKKKKQT